MAVEVSEAELGEWRYTVTALQVPYENFAYLVSSIEVPEWTFWVLGVGVEIGAAIGLFALIKARRWL